MAIAAQNAGYLYGGPAASNQVVRQSAITGAYSGTTHGVVTFTGDGATTTAVINYIDGTATLAAVPSGILATINGGNDTAGAAIVKVVDNGDKKGCTVTFAPAIANTKTAIVCFQILP